MKNTFGWVQLGTSDSKQARDFYEKLFKWSLNSKKMHGGGEYIEVDAGEGPCAGISPSQKLEGSHWTPFVNVNDIHEYTEKAEKLGAKIVVPITDLGGGEGFFSVFVDPTGAVLGLYAPK